MKIVSTLVDELHDRIEQLDWMSAPTKEQALAKLGAFTRKIGYPDKWRDYSKLENQAPASIWPTCRAAASFESARDWAKIGKPVDLHRMGDDPAYGQRRGTTRSWNQITFPAGILQPPFYNPRRRRRGELRRDGRGDRPRDDPWLR